MTIGVEGMDLFKIEFESILGSDNIVNQIGSLGLDLIKTGLNAVAGKNIFHHLSYYKILICQ